MTDPWFVEIKYYVTSVLTLASFVPLDLTLDSALSAALEVEGCSRSMGSSPESLDSLAIY